MNPEIDMSSTPQPKPQPGRNGFTYRPQFGVIVVCTDESHQQEVFSVLQAAGYRLKVVTV